MSNDSEQNLKDKRKPRYGGNFGYLFVALLLTLLVIPINHGLPGVGRPSVTLLFSLFMLVSVWSLVASRWVFQLGTLLVLAVSGIVGIGTFMGASQTLELIGLLLMLIFCSLSAFIAGRNVFVMHRVDLNSLIGAFCVYLLIGLIWALLYRLLHLYGLATFSGNMTDQEQAILPDLVYFSFVTLASLGYGDISPIGGLLRTLAYLEAVIGQFYLAVMVASLVGVYSNRRKQE